MADCLANHKDSPDLEDECSYYHEEYYWLFSETIRPAFTSVLSELEDLHEKAPEGAKKDAY